MRIGVKDKRIKAAMQAGEGDAVKGLQPVEAQRIRYRVVVLQASDTLREVADNHPEWRVHRWKGNTIWSIDVLANTRLLFSYDARQHEVAGMVYDDPH